MVNWPSPEEGAQFLQLLGKITDAAYSSLREEPKFRSYPLSMIGSGQPVMPTRQALLKAQDVLEHATACLKHIYERKRRDWAVADFSYEPVKEPEAANETRLDGPVHLTFPSMPDDRPLSIPDRSDVLFAISRGLNNRHGHEHAARVSAEVVLATLEAQQFVIMRKPPARDTSPQLFEH